MIGSITYLAFSTRLDLNFSISVPSRHLHNPWANHLAQAKRVFRYISGTLSYGLQFPSCDQATSSDVCAAVDSDCGGDVEKRRSTTSFLVSVNGTPIYWMSKTQTVITLSSAEAEYAALSACAKEFSWFGNFNFEIVNTHPYNDSAIPASPIYVNSTTALSMGKKEKSTPRTKHIDMKLHHVRKLIEQNFIAMKLPTYHRPVDVLTKIQIRNQITRCVRLLRFNDFKFCLCLFLLGCFRR